MSSRRIGSDTPNMSPCSPVVPSQIPTDPNRLIDNSCGLPASSPGNTSLRFAGNCTPDFTSNRATNDAICARDTSNVGPNEPSVNPCANP